MRFNYTMSQERRTDPDLEIRSAKLVNRMRLAHFLTDFLSNKLSLHRGKKISRSITKRFLPHFSSLVISPTILGFDLVVPGGTMYYYDGYYEIGTLKVMSECLGQGDIFLDIGASRGQMALHGSTLVGNKGKVLAFEPHPQRYSTLIAAIAINKRENIIAYQAGLSDSEDELKLHTDRPSPSMVADGKHDKDYEMVRTLRLDSVLHDENVSTVRMIKIDVEGFELNVLRGASELLSSPNAPIICMEHEIYGGDCLAPLSYLVDINDYKFFNLERTKNYASKLRRVDRIEDVRLHDNVFCFRTDHIDQLEGSGLFAA